MSLRKLALVTAMWVLGLAAIAAFASVVAWSNGSPVQVPADAQVPTAAPTDKPLAALTSGVARSLGTAGVQLTQGDRSRASHATDAALRAGEVGHAAGHGRVKKAFAAALHAVHQARERLHNGDAAGAGYALERAVDHLEPAIDAAAKQSPGVPTEPVWTGYEEAMLVNANGSTIGEVCRIEEGPNGPVARLRVGGSPDVLGLVDLDGTVATVPADRLLWGPRRSIGSTLVVAPTHRSDPVAVTRALR